VLARIEAILLDFAGKLRKGSLPSLTFAMRNSENLYSGEFRIPVKKIKKTNFALCVDENKNSETGLKNSNDIIILGGRRVQCKFTSCPKKYARLCSMLAMLCNQILTGQQMSILFFFC
jgi:hypothetical protein